MSKYVSSVRETKEDRSTTPRSSYTRVEERERTSTSHIPTYSSPRAPYGYTPIDYSPLRYSPTYVSPRTTSPTRTVLEAPLVSDQLYSDMFKENQQLRKDLRDARGSSRRLEEKLSKLSKDLNEVLLKVHTASTERDAYRADVQKLRGRLSEYNIHNLKLEMENRALDSYLKVVKDDLEYYRAYFNRSQTLEPGNGGPSRDLALMSRDYRPQIGEGEEKDDEVGGDYDDDEGYGNSPNHVSSYHSTTTSKYERVGRDLYI